MASYAVDRPRVEAASGGYRRLLVPITDSPESMRAMETACALAADHGATIVGVYVIEVSPLLPLDAQMADEAAAAREALDRAQAIADAFGVRLQRRILHARDAGRAIVGVADEAGSELVVVGAPRSRRLLGRRSLFGGSIRHVLTHTACRVFLVA